MCQCIAWPHAQSGGLLGMQLVGFVDIGEIKVWTALMVCQKSVMTNMDEETGHSRHTSKKKEEDHVRISSFATSVVQEF